VKHIEKQEEPIELSEWRAEKQKRRHKQWKNVPTGIKDVIREALRREQGFICCYCGCRVSTNNDSHVEHLIPKRICRKHLPNGEHDYTNLLLSCQRDPKPPADARCGWSKKDWYDEDLMVSPLSADCERRFHFRADGRVFPKRGDDLGAQETIDRLRLDCGNLRAERREAINAILNDDILLHDADVRRMINRYHQRDQNRRFEAFCIAVIQVLSDYLGDQAAKR